MRDALIDWAHGWNAMGLLLVVATCAAGAAAAAWLVRRFSPLASGSGIPHVEAVLAGDVPPAPPQLIPVKFIGGLLAIGSGLALGREGPTVQMGAGAAHLMSKIFRRSWSDGRVLLAAGAGAGLATAFNAPIAGAFFVLEELMGRFDARIILATCGASASAIAVARVFLGQQPDFAVEPLPFPSFSVLPACLVLGLVAGLLGVAYNHTILGALAAAKRLGRWPVELCAAVIGAAVGLLAWFSPDFVGGGDAITRQMFAGTAAVTLLPLVFLLRFVIGPTSYAAGTPGGLFSPMLALGSLFGLYFGTYYCRWFPDPTAIPAAFAVVGTAAFFTAVVRAPLTGVVLVVELTAAYTQFLPMLAACFTAMLVPTMFHNPPIYESLRPICASASTLAIVYPCRWGKGRVACSRSDTGVSMVATMLSMLPRYRIKVFTTLNLHSICTATPA